MSNKTKSKQKDRIQILSAIQKAANLYKNNEWIEQNGFKESHMRCYAILKPEILQDIKDTMSYLNGYAEKHTDECKGIDDYILKKIKRVVKS